MSFDNNYTNDRLLVDGGQVTFDLAGYVYSLEFSGEGDESVVVGHLGTGKLTVTGGKVSTRTVTLGRNTDSEGELVVTTGGFWEAQKEQWQSMWIAHNGVGKLTIDSGGLVRQGHGAAGIQPYGRAIINVSGEESDWYVDGWFGLGGQGHADLTISDNAYVSMGRCEMAISEGSVAYARLDNYATWHFEELLGDVL